MVYNKSVSQRKQQEFKKMKKNDIPNFEIVYTTFEAAAVLKIRYHTLRVWISQGKIPSYLHGKINGIRNLIMSDNKNKKYKSKLSKIIRQLGHLMVGYTFVKALGAVVAIVLERLITELNYAIRNSSISSSISSSSLRISL